MSEFSRLWKHQNNPTCIKSISVTVRGLKLDAIEKQKKNCAVLDPTRLGAATDKLIQGMPAVTATSSADEVC